MRPIIVVTGANGGIGFGICQRLLVQLSSSNPSDAEPQLDLCSPTENTSGDQKSSSCVQGLILIMACRSLKRAEAARTELYNFLDAHIKVQRGLPGYDGHADTFRRNLEIEVHHLDLADIRTVFQFGRTLSLKYSYISHLILNAGVVSFSGMNWAKAAWQLCTSPLLAMTAPEFYSQHQGELSVDGLGWVWQCNVFSHFCLFRTLQPLLFASKSPLGARVIWMSSLEASPSLYDPDDWQLIKTEHSYESSKYQIDLIATNLDRRALEQISGEAAVEVRHVVVQPGIVSTNIDNALTGSFLNFFKLLAFYIVRFFNSQHHIIHPYKAAIAAVHLSLISLSFIPAFALPSSSSSSSIPNGFTIKPQPVRFGSETDRWGTECVGVTPVKQWEEHAREGDQLLDKFDELYKAFAEGEGMPDRLSHIPPPVVILEKSK